MIYRALIPFGSLIKAKKKLSKAEAAERAAILAEEAENEEQPIEYSRKTKDLSKRLPSQQKRSNGSLMKADRASKHA